MEEATRFRRFVALLGFSWAAACGAPICASTEIDRAFARLYNFDFPGANTILDSYIRSEPADPLGYAVRAASYLFYELNRLGILESEFFADDKRIAEKKKLKPDLNIRSALFQAVEQAESRAFSALEKDRKDENALFSLGLTSGIVTDYMALVEKKQMGSFSHVKRSSMYAQRLLRLDPQFYDAYLTVGITEYLLGSVPFFIRWFVHIDNVKGSKEWGVKNLQIVAEKGHYLKPFARILLALAYLRGKKLEQSRALLKELSHDYPENPLFQKELAKISSKIHNGRVQ